MADPVIPAPTNKPFFVIDISRQDSVPIIPDSYISNHFKGKAHSTTMKLTSDASETIWEVELDGGRFAKGWKDFSVSHCVRDDDVLSFRHDGDMVFHVTPLGRSFSPIQLISSTSDDLDDDDGDGERNIFDDDDGDGGYEHNIFDDDEEVDVGYDDHDDDGNWTLEEDDDLTPKKTSSKKRSRTETESLFLVWHVTHSSLRRDIMCVSKKFAMRNGLHMRKCEIDVLDIHEKSWTMRLSHNKSTGQAFIFGGWRSFCIENGIEAGSFCTFKLVQTGTKPVLGLCTNNSSKLVPQGNSAKAKEIQNVSGSDGIESEDFSDTALMNHSKTVTIDFKPYMYRCSQLRLPPSFTRANGIEEAGDITIVSKDGTVCKTHLVLIKGREQYYISGCRALFAANGIIKVGDSFTIEAIRGGTSPILKFFPKVKEASFDGYTTPVGRGRKRGEETETRVKKRARVSVEGGGSSRRTRASNNPSANDPGTLHCKQPVQPCSISDQVTRVKQSIVDILTSVRHFRSELEIKENNLEASLVEIDALGEKITGISKIFSMNQV